MANQTISNQNISSAPVTRKRVGRAQEAWGRFRNSKSAVIGMVIVAALVMIALTADIFFDYQADCIKPDITQRLQWPSVSHLLGTDALGRDLLARMAFGARYSLFISVSAVALSLFVGAILGSMAGYYGGKIDNIIMRGVDVFASIPSLLMSICIAAALGQSLFNMILAIGIAGIPALTRIVRATALSIRGQEYVEAGRAMGGSSAQIIFFHLLPNCIAPLIIQCTLRIAGAILSTTSLCFLGIGIKPPTPEWGNLLSDGRVNMRVAGYLTMFPGFAILITILGFNLMGDGLRDALDPKMKR
jgi:peptide/nickel transport system permease protein